MKRSTTRRRSGGSMRSGQVCVVCWVVDAEATGGVRDAGRFVCVVCLSVLGYLYLDSGPWIGLWTAWTCLSALRGRCALTISFFPPFYSLARFDVCVRGQDREPTGSIASRDCYGWPGALSYDAESCSSCWTLCCSLRSLDLGWPPAEDGGPSSMVAAPGPGPSAGGV